MNTFIYPYSLLFYFSNNFRIFILPPFILHIFLIVSHNQNILFVNSFPLFQHNLNALIIFFLELMPIVVKTLGQSGLKDILLLLFQGKLPLSECPNIKVQKIDNSFLLIRLAWFGLFSLFKNALFEGVVFGLKLFLKRGGFLTDDDLLLLQVDG